MDGLRAKSIMVTGGAGFLGSFVVDQLRNTQCAEIMIPRSSDYDLRNQDVAISYIKKTKPDIIIHLAASFGGIGANRQNPGKYLYDNLSMGIHLIEGARLAGVEKFVICGTVCSYPAFTPVPFKEDDLWNGYPEETNAPYGLAKKMLTVQAQAYDKQYGFTAISLLPVNIYGPRDNFDPLTSNVVASLIRKCVEAKEEGRDHLIVWGSGIAKREFIYVEDAARAFVLAAARYNQVDPVNIGTGKEVSIKELTELIADLVGFTGNIVWDPSMPDGQLRRCVDVQKAKERFGFEATVDIKEGLKKTIDWYLENRTKTGFPK